VPRLRPRAAIVLLVLLAMGALQACGTNDSTEGPPFESRNIDRQRSLLITNSDIEAVGPSTPYGAVLRWWQALQRGKVEKVRRSYARPISRAEARRQVRRGSAGRRRRRPAPPFRPRFSQPLNAEVVAGRRQATVNVVVRAATRDRETPGVVQIQDFSTGFRLLRRAGEWKLRAGSFRHYLHSRKGHFTPGPTD
jgi:hypothetical protein